MENLYYTLFPFIPSEWPLLVKVNALIAFSFVWAAFLLFLFILLSRLRDGIRVSQKRVLEKEAQEFITSYLFSEEAEQDMPLLENFRKKYLRTPFQRQIVLHNLILLHKNIIGETAARLRGLYQELGLYAYSKQKLYASAWEEIATGIGELAEMRMHQDRKLIEAFINHPNTTLRSEAQVALLKLQRDIPFSFLDKLEEPITEWQQLQLARAAQKADQASMPDFSKWLNKREETIVIFCIRMIAQYNQLDGVPALLELLSHPSAGLRKEVIIALRQMEAFEASERLLQGFWRETPENRLEVLKTLRAIAGEQALPLYEELLAAPDKELQLAAAKAIAHSGASGAARMKSINNDMQHQLQPIAAYALDHRL